MTKALSSWARMLRVPLAPLVPMMIAVLCLLGLLAGIHAFVVLPAQSRVDDLQEKWQSARARFVKHVEARRTLQELAEVLRVIPLKQDYVPLALGITEEASRHRVSLPSLSYRVQSSPGALASKAFFTGAASGQYEDLRRFIRELELAEELLFIEDLDVVRSSVQQNRELTFKLTIATYLREPPDSI